MRTTRLFICGALLVLAGCGSSSPRPDLLLVTVDTLRQDHVSSYGAPFGETACMDALAADGALFGEHYATVTLTAPAHASLFTGLYPSEHGLRRNGQSLSRELPGLPALLAAEGYETAAFLGAAVLSARFGFDHGFAVFDEDFEEGNIDMGGESVHFERQADRVVERAVEWLERQGEAPICLWVHLFDPHKDHARPEVEWPALEEIEGQGGVLARPGPLYDRDEIVNMRRGYLAEVRYVDQQLSRLIKAWDERPRETESLVVLTADHGEGLAEHSYAGHSLYLYEEQLRIPLIMRMPGKVPAGTRVEAISSAVDVAQTIAELLELGVASRLGGESLVPRLHMPGPDAQAFAFAERPGLAGRRSRFIAGQLKQAKPERNKRNELLNARMGKVGGAELESVALLQDGWKYIWAEDAPDELYRLREDPLERRNRRKELQEKWESMSAAVSTWRAGLRVRVAEGQGEVSEDDAHMLDQLGYGGGGS